MQAPYFDALLALPRRYGIIIDPTFVIVVLLLTDASKGMLFESIPTMFLSASRWLLCLHGQLTAILAIQASQFYTTPLDADQLACLLPFIHGSIIVHDFFVPQVPPISPDPLPKRNLLET